MAFNENTFRPWLHRNHSSSSLRGLEIAIPPGEVVPRPQKPLAFAYDHKDLPPVPRKTSSRKSTTALRKVSDTYKVMFADGPYAVLDRKMSEDATYRDKLRQTDLASHKIDMQDANIVHSEKLHSVSRNAPPLVVQSSQEGYQHWSEIVSPEQWVDPSMRWSTSDSCYSTDEVDTVSEGERRSWMNSTENTSPDTLRDAFYLQPKTYSASTTSQMNPISPPIVPHSSRPSSLRCHEKSSLAVDVDKIRPLSARLPLGRYQRAPIPPTPGRLMSLDDMIDDERHRFKTEEFSRELWQPSLGSPSPLAHTAPKTPSAGQHPSGSRYESIPAREIVPRPLTLRQRRSYRDSISHFSDASDNEADRPKIFSHARSSVLSQVRKISTIAAGSLTFQKAAIGLQPPLIKRKRAHTNTKHPPRSPFPFHANDVAPKDRMEISSPLEMPDQHRRSSSISKRISSLMRKPLGLDVTAFLQAQAPSQPQVQTLSKPLSRTDSSVPSSVPSQSRTIISNYARAPSGPDTPLPVPTDLPSKANLMSNLTPMLHKGKGVVSHVRKGVKVQSAAERRRDKLRKEIVLIGPADQYPDGRVNTWF